MEKITKFTDLISWKEAHKLVLLIYKLSEKFPEKEKFGLTNQIRRASVSITSNVAEGFGRNSAKDKNYFYTMSKTSLAEVENQSIISRDLEFIKNEEYLLIEKQINLVGRLMTGLIRSSSDKILH